MGLHTISSQGKEITNIACGSGEVFHELIYAGLTVSDRKVRNENCVNQQYFIRSLSALQCDFSTSPVINITA